MTIPATIQNFLADHHVNFELISHPRAYTSLGTASAAQIEPDRLLKGVLLEDDRGYVVAVLPATCHVKLRAIRRETRRDVRLATEGEARQCFRDCDPGAVPVLAPAYGVEAFWDESLLEQPDVYFEAGDHERLVHLATQDLVTLFGQAWHGRFGKRIAH